jgi:hypothetical protein
MVEDGYKKPRPGGRGLTGVDSGGADFLRAFFTRNALPFGGECFRPLLYECVHEEQPARGAHKRR